jgi:hypothetical protein
LDFSDSGKIQKPVSIVEGKESIFIIVKVINGKTSWRDIKWGDIKQ